MRKQIQHLLICFCGGVLLSHPHPLHVPWVVPCPSTYSSVGAYSSDSTLPHCPVGSSTPTTASVGHSGLMGVLWWADGGQSAPMHLLLGTAVNEELANMQLIGGDSLGDELIRANIIIIACTDADTVVAGWGGEHITHSPLGLKRTEELCRSSHCCCCGWAKRLLGC